MNAPTSSIPLKKVLTTRETLIFFAAWGVVAFFVLGVNPDDEFISSWAITLPAGWLMYQVSFRWLLPRTFKTRFPLPRYMAFILLYGLTVFFVTSAILSMYMEDEAYFMVMGGITLSILFFIQAPVQWYVFKRQVRDHEELTGLRKELGQTEANIDLLRSQINPHFLFNALNNIYTLTVIKSDQAPDNLLKLSGMLRYMLYDCKADRVPLQKEIEYLRHYIDLNLLKDSRGLNVEVDLDESRPQLPIAPMLLIPFVENAFKHSKVEDLNKGWIKIKLRTGDDNILFQVQNSVPDSHFTKDQAGGIGLQNVRRQLELVYPGRHELKIEAGLEVFSVELRVFV